MKQRVKAREQGILLGKVRRDPTISMKRGRMLGSEGIESSGTSIRTRRHRTDIRKLYAKKMEGARGRRYSWAGSRHMGCGRANQLIDAKKRGSHRATETRRAQRLVGGGPRWR